ncbi:MAG: hypothetical protein LBV68_06280 [Spirochaetaceae bacterium]|nr:hypothetical protein [Spirochaetaceae bacterium]
MKNDGAPDGNAVDVHLVMPVGGVETGLYRSPQLNDIILVGETGTGSITRYLIGYVPQSAVAIGVTKKFDSVNKLMDDDKPVLPATFDTSKVTAPVAAKYTGGAGNPQYKFDNKVYGDCSSKGQGPTIKWCTDNYAALGGEKTGEEEKKRDIEQNIHAKALSVFFLQVGDSNGIPSWPAAVSKAGLVLRYKKQGDNTAKAKLLENLNRSDTTPTRKAYSRKMEYSEIGFYKDMTPFTTARKGTDGNEERDAEGKVQKYYPEIDRINIQSTGDIDSTAVNRHLMKAKRFEILANVDEVDHTKKSLSADELPLGDVMGDNYGLSKGDVQVRAGGRVIIKADSEITFQVGRTKLTIKDGSFEVSSRQIKGSNVPTDFDPVIKFSSRGGVSIGGSSVGISAGWGWNILDSMGSGITGTLGGIAQFGRSINLGTNTAFANIFTTAIFTSNFAFNMKLMTMAKDKDYDFNPAYLSAIKSMIQSMVKLLQGVATSIIQMKTDYSKEKADFKKLMNEKYPGLAQRDVSDFLIRANKDGVIAGVANYESWIAENHQEELAGWANLNLFDSTPGGGPKPVNSDGTVNLY